MFEIMFVHVIAITLPTRRESRQFFWFCSTLADKARQDVWRYSTVRYCPTSSDLVVDLWEFAAHQLSAGEKSASGVALFIHV